MVDRRHGTRWVSGIQIKIEDRIEGMKVILYILITCNSYIRGVSVWIFKQLKELGVKLKN